MPKNQLEGINIAMLALTTIIFIARIALRVAQRKPYESHDFLYHLASICYSAMWVTFLQENEPLWRVEGVQRGEVSV